MARTLAFSDRLLSDLIPCSVEFYNSASCRWMSLKRVLHMQAMREEEIVGQVAVVLTVMKDDGLILNGQTDFPFAKKSLIRKHFFFVFFLC